MHSIQKNQATETNETKIYDAPTNILILNVNSSNSYAQLIQQLEFSPVSNSIRIASCVNILSEPAVIHCSVCFTQMFNINIQCNNLKSFMCILLNQSLYIFNNYCRKYQ